MTWLLWLGVVVAVLLIGPVALRMVGAMRWADLIRTRTGQLEAARVDGNGRLPLHVRDLQGQVLLTLSENDSTWQQLRRALQPHRVEPAAIVETSYSGTVCLMVREGEGAGAGIVKPYVASVFDHELIARRLLPATPVEVVMAFAGQVGLSQAGREFAELMRGHFAATREQTDNTHVLGAHPPYRRCGPAPA